MIDSHRRETMCNLSRHMSALLAAFAGGAWHGRTGPLRIWHETCRIGLGPIPMPEFPEASEVERRDGLGV